MRANYRPDEVAEPKTARRGEAPEWHRDWWKSLSPERRTTLRCVTSHAAQFLIPVVTERPVRAFTMLREPVGRVISAYFFIRWMDQHGNHSPMLATMRQRGWALKHVYRSIEEQEPTVEFARLFWPLFDGQTREILAPTVDPYRAPLRSGPQELVRQREAVLDLLSRKYVVGVSERFEQSVRLFADTFGWNRVFAPRDNVSPHGWSASEIDEETRSLIRRHNRVDAEIHERYSSSLDSAHSARGAGALRWRLPDRGRHHVARLRDVRRRRH